MNTLFFAFRNMKRNKLRAAATIGAMALAGGVMILYSTLVDGIVVTMERNIVEMETGEIEIHAADYREDPDIYIQIKDHERLVEKLSAIGFNAAPRLYGFGLAAAGTSSSGVWLRGVNVRQEAKVTQLDRHLASGAWLSEDDPKGVVIGKKLSKSLNAATGSEIVVVSQALDGSTANDIFIVRGVMKSVSENLDRSGVMMTDEAFRALMSMPSGVHQIAVSRNDHVETLSAAAARVKEASPGLEVKTWRELKPIIANMLDTVDVTMMLMLLITYTAIVIVTLNAMLMNVFERIPEFGVMKAIGMTPLKVMALVSAEALAQAIVACILALAIGLPFSFYAQSHGFDLSRFWTGGAVGGVAFDPIWKAKVTFKSVMTPLAALFIVAMTSVIYPGLKAALIKPREAIYHR